MWDSLWPGRHFFLRLKTVRASTKLACVTQCYFTHFVALIGCRSIQLCPEAFGSAPVDNTMQWQANLHLFSPDICLCITIIISFIIMILMSQAMMGMLLITGAGRRQEKHTESFTVKTVKPWQIFNRCTFTPSLSPLFITARSSSRLSVWSGQCEKQQ